MMVITVGLAAGFIAFKQRFQAALPCREVVTRAPVIALWRSSPASGQLGQAWPHIRGSACTLIITPLSTSLTGMLPITG
jgi:hypothetical protein